MTTHYFPDADVPALQPFTQAFVRMMFAHAAFERRVSDLMNVITGIVGFGEQPDALWSAHQRPKRMKMLIDEYRPDGLPEAASIMACLKLQFHFFVIVTCLLMGLGGSSTRTQTPSRFDPASNGLMKISIERLRSPKSKTPPTRSASLKWSFGIFKRQSRRALRG